MSNKQNENNKNAKHQFSNTEPLTHSPRVALANEMSNKQSSIDWFINELEFELGYRIENTRMGREIIQEAKARHKEEVIKICHRMQIVDDVDFDGNVTFIFNPEQNYNETFEGNHE